MEEMWKKKNDDCITQLCQNVLVNMAESREIPQDYKNINDVTEIYRALISRTNFYVFARFLKVAHFSFYC